MLFGETTWRAVCGKTSRTESRWKVEAGRKSLYFTLSRMLAHLLRSNLVAESYVPPEDLREIRALIKHRLSLVKIRASVKNKVHALIDRNGLQSQETFSDLFGKSGISWLNAVRFSSSLDRLMLDNYLEHLVRLGRQIKAVDQEILSRASGDEDVRLLVSMTGISVYTALLLKSLSQKSS
jgi:transposase